ncbi:HlyD family efflux transporter periplasmic adaptor subunit [Cellulophaga omnivescoria]|uniref:HlyD family efflux transporter periplasmic adaptor subunit n=1 Tax=Cellulophaga omnivescoria TaxID=1888890 RepID=UPI000986489B|nr:HlyD family efflux transporter periplasmic adaptor subunit [Cellulophaga omnivescoria]
MKKIDFLDERSDFVKEILETPPNSIISWGNTFFLAFVFLILLLSWFIKYPDVVISEVVITTNNPPIYLATKTEGKIDSILKSNKEFAEKNEWLAIIGSNANIRHIKILDTILKNIKALNYDLESMHGIDFPILDVGEIQSNYNSLVKAVSKFKHHEEDGNYNTQSQLNNLRVNQYNSLINGAIRDKEISEKELEVAKIDLDRHENLLDKGVIALQEYESIKLRYLQAIRSVQGNISSITQIRAQKASLLSQGGNLKHTEDESHLNSELDILEAIKLTELSYVEWIKKHVLVGTVSGEVNYLNYFTNNQYVESSEKLISIIPKYSEHDYFGIAKMPIINSGKVKLGQTVNIKLLGFPENQFGVLLGSVTNISDVPNEDFYLVKVNLSEGLNTTFNKEITFKQKIDGNAEIITEDLRLIERFVYTLTKAFN